MLMLFSLTDTILDDDNANAGQTQLYVQIKFKIVQLPLPSNEKCCEILFKNAFIDMKLDEVKS